MAELKDQIKTAMDEARTLVLGAQVLLGFQYQDVFQKRFEQLPPEIQYLRLGGLCMLLASVALLLVPAAYHRTVEQGRVSTELRSFVSWAVSRALVPFALALGVDFFTAVRQVAGTVGGVGGGVSAVLLALFLWYGLGHRHRRHVRRQHQQGLERFMEHEEGSAEPEAADRCVEEIPLDEKIRQALTETRVVLPGAQALLGFQFAAMLMEGFEKLPPPSVYLHLASLGLTAIAILLLMTPAAYHRIAERGEDTRHFHRLSGRMITAAMAFLAPGMCGDFLVVTQKVTHSYPLAALLGGLALIAFYGLWFGYTLWKRAEVVHHYRVSRPGQTRPHAGAR